MVNDTRNNHVVTDLQAVFDGNIEEFIEAYLSTKLSNCFQGLTLEAVHG